MIQYKLHQHGMVVIPLRKNKKEVVFFSHSLDYNLVDTYGKVTSKMWVEENCPSVGTYIEEKYGNDISFVDESREVGIYPDDLNKVLEKHKILISKAMLEPSKKSKEVI